MADRKRRKPTTGKGPKKDSRGRAQASGSRKQASGSRKQASGSKRQGTGATKAARGRKPPYTADRKPRSTSGGASSKKKHYTADKDSHYTADRKQRSSSSSSDKTHYTAAKKSDYKADRKPHYTSDNKPTYSSGKPAYGKKPGSGGGKSRGGRTDRKAGIRSDGLQTEGPKRKFIRIEGLPGGVQEDLARVTPGARVQGALEALRDAVKAYTKGQFRRALSAAERAKELAPRDATVREILGLSAYRSEEWKTSLRELRTYRRLAGEVTHLPVEMDCLRAMGRSKDVGEAFKELQRRRASGVVLKEGKVVYGSHLLDEGKADQAWPVVKPGRITTEPFPEDLRVWFVAGRAAAALGDVSTATKLREAISKNDPTFEGLAALDEEIARA